ncbi:MAG: hypothetical protein LBL58_09430 [Tannerellaceae bacterium]|jgi:hypothetical protein|nr:hypothetical protein [Tannerellaceae bacterium]
MRNFYLLIAGVIFSLCSCSEEGNTPIVKEEVQGGELVVKTKAVETPETQAFKGSDIKSFNVETGEITFVNLSYHDICGSLAYDRKFTFYLDEDLLFTATAVGSFSSSMINDLVFYYDGKRMYLKDGYPDFSIHSNPNLNEQQRQERKEAAEKRKPAWERFVRYLDENNLLTDRDSDVPTDDDSPDIPVPSVDYDLSATITHEGDSETWTSMVFIGKSILSFNPETREIVFSDYNILSNLCEFAPIQLNIFREGNLLLSATVIASDNPQTVNDLVFQIETKKQDGFYRPGEFKYYIPDGYPALENLESGMEEAQRIREENAQKRDAEWNTFIRYLNDAGKIEQ